MKIQTRRKVITRFAPSPTGYLHIGNARTALINYLYARSNQGEFILRIDDTDVKRSREIYKYAIATDLEWLRFKWDRQFHQSSRLNEYAKAKEQLIASGRLYPCYETPEEIEVKRKLQLSRGMPPIYDRGALKLTNTQQQKYLDEGRKPHYRFFINDSDIFWNDLVKGDIRYHGLKLSDPVIIREDGSMTYMMCSTVDDIKHNISHVIRGEDHVSNTAIQIQMFEALGASPPVFGHLSLVTAQHSKISKRIGGYEIRNLRDDYKLDSMAVNSFFTFIGSSSQMRALKNMDELIAHFDINTYSKSPTTFIFDALLSVNHKLVINYNWDEVKDRVMKFDLPSSDDKKIDAQFWNAVRPNIRSLSDIKDWWEICHFPKKPNNINVDKMLIDAAIKNLPDIIAKDTWKNWTKAISKETGLKGKDLFMPLRLILTGKDSGPELKNLLPLLSSKEIKTRLQENY